MIRRFLSLAAIVAASVLPMTAAASDGLDRGDTAWILTATALVLLMTLPGLALFYGGLVQARNFLSVLMHCAVVAALASVLWLVCGYAIAFGDGGALNAIWGGLSKSFLSGVDSTAMAGTIPESAFFMFQMTFAIITPALIVGAYPERVRFPAVVLFSGAWLLIVYAPVCHWIWGGGWLAEMGVMDFAGGLVVHATAGTSALVIAVMVGKRRGFPSALHPPHSPGLTMIGASLLWVGWFGFNGGSALAADGSAAMAITATHLSAAAASLVWAGLEWLRFGKPSLIGLVTGCIAGLASVTPASGFIGPIGGLLLGVAGAAICFAAVSLIKFRFKIDDSLDVFAVHGVGGILGTLAVAFLALPAFGGLGLADGMTAGSQFGVQAIATVATVVWSVLASVVILLVVRALVGLRVSTDDEIEGLDVTAHGERSYLL
jgi:Amt family ammonium transporter